MHVFCMKIVLSRYFLYSINVRCTYRCEKGIFSPDTPSSPQLPLISLHLSQLTAAGNSIVAQAADGNVTRSAIPHQIRSALVGSLLLSDGERSELSPCLARHTHTYSCTVQSQETKHSNSGAIWSRFTAHHCNPAVILENTKPSEVWRRSSL